VFLSEAFSVRYAHKHTMLMQVIFLNKSFFMQFIGKLIGTRLFLTEFSEAFVTIGVHSVGIA